MLLLRLDPWVCWKKERRCVYFIMRGRRSKEIIIIYRSFSTVTKFLQGFLYTSWLSKYPCPNYQNAPPAYQNTPLLIIKFHLPSTKIPLQFTKLPFIITKVSLPIVLMCSPTIKRFPRYIKHLLQFTKIPLQTTKLHCQIVKPIPTQDINHPVPTSKIILDASSSKRQLWSPLSKFWEKNPLEHLSL